MKTFTRKHDQNRHDQNCTGLKRKLEEPEKHSPPEKKQKLSDEEVIEYEVSSLHSYEVIKTYTHRVIKYKYVILH